MKKCVWCCLDDSNESLSRVSRAYGTIHDQLEALEHSDAAERCVQAMLANDMYIHESCRKHIANAHTRKLRTGKLSKYLFFLNSLTMSLSSSSN